MICPVVFAPRIQTYATELKKWNIISWEIYMYTLDTDINKLGPSWENIHATKRNGNNKELYNRTTSVFLQLEWIMYKILGMNILLSLKDVR
jgi:hypothetical protein